MYIYNKINVIEDNLYHYIQYILHVHKVDIHHSNSKNIVPFKLLKFLVALKSFLDDLWGLLMLYACAHSLVNILGNIW